MSEHHPAATAGHAEDDGQGRHLGSPRGISLPGTTSASVGSGRPGKRSSGKQVCRCRRLVAYTQ